MVGIEAILQAHVGIKGVLATHQAKSRWRKGNQPSTMEVQISHLIMIEIIAEHQVQREEDQAVVVLTVVVEMKI